MQVQRRTRDPSKRPGRPTKRGIRVVQLSAYVDEKEALAIQRVANTLRISTSELLHEALQLYTLKAMPLKLQTQTP